MTLQPIVYPLTILHGPGHDYSRWDSPEGIREAASAGALATDVNAQASKGRKFVPTHWRFPGDHGFHAPSDIAHRAVAALTEEQLALFVSSSGHRIHPMREVMATAASHGITLCIEVKSDGDFEQLRADAEATGCRVIVMTLPHLGGKNVGYRRLEKAKAAGLPTMVLLNTTRFAKGQVPASEWKHVDYVKGPEKWQKGRPARVIPLGPGSKYGMTVSPGNARQVTTRLRKKWPTQPPAPKPPEVTVPATVAQALAHCARQSAHGPRFGVNECKIQCRTAYQVPSDGSATAAIAWSRTKFKHPIPDNSADIPDGALLWWTGGTPTKSHPAGAGHVTVKTPGVQCWSTDFKRSGFFDLVDVLAISRKWTKLKLVGWSEDIDGVRVLHANVPPPKPPTPTEVRLDPASYFIGARGEHVTWLGKRLVAHGFGGFYRNGPGPTFTLTDRLSVIAFQRAQGWTGGAADGLPGTETLKRLAARVAKKPKPPVTPPAKPPKATGHVVDYSFARPDPAALKAAGFETVVRYISRRAGAKGVSRKDLTKAEAKRLHAAGLGILLVWETTASRAGEGKAAGVADAKAAEAQAAALGYPADLPIFYAVDSDMTAAQVRPYFAGVKSVSKRPVDGSYGGVKIADAALTDYVWQTQAWSGGRVSTKAHMLQLIHPTLKVKGAATGWDQNELRKPIPTWRP